MFCFPMLRFGNAFSLRDSDGQKISVEEFEKVRDYFNSSSVLSKLTRKLDRILSVNEEQYVLSPCENAQCLSGGMFFASSFWKVELRNGKNGKKTQKTVYIWFVINSEFGFFNKVWVNVLFDHRPFKEVSHINTVDFFNKYRAVSENFLREILSSLDGKFRQYERKEKVKLLLKTVGSKDNNFLDFCERLKEREAVSFRKEYREALACNKASVYQSFLKLVFGKDLPDLAKYIDFVEAYKSEKQNLRGDLDPLPPTLQWEPFGFFQIKCEDRIGLFAKDEFIAENLIQHTGVCRQKVNGHQDVPESSTRSVSRDLVNLLSTHL